MQKPADLSARHLDDFSTFGVPAIQGWSHWSLIDKEEAPPLAWRSYMYK